MRERLFGALGLGRQKAPEKTSEKPKLKEIDLSIEIGNSPYLLSKEAQRHLERAEASDYKKSRSILIINEPHFYIEGQFNLYKGLGIFFRDNPSLIGKTVFLAEGFPANQSVSVQSLIDEEPNPSDELIKEVLGSFLITGYMAYEWKYQQGIPIFGTEDEWFYDMGMAFATTLAEDPDAISGTVTYERGKTVDIKVIDQWIFSMVVRNKSIARTLVDKAGNYENPILFAGRTHLDRMPDRGFHKMKDLADIPMFGLFGPYARSIAENAENFGLYDYLKKEKIGFTFLNPVGIDSEESNDEKDAYAYNRLFKTQREAMWKGQSVDYKEYLEWFLAQRSSKQRTTIRPSPEVAVQLVRMLKDKQKSSGAQSGIIYERSGEGGGEGSGEGDSERGGAERENWFKISREEESAKIREKFRVDSIWELPPAIRGEAYEVLRGAEPASNLKHVDDIRLEARTATGMKTIELRDKTYQDVRGLNWKVRECIDELSGYPGGIWKRRTFTRGDDFDDVYLEIGIPAGKATQTQIEKLVELQEYAQTKDVTLVIVEVP